MDLHDSSQWIGLITLAATIWWIVRRRHDDADYQSQAAAAI